MASRRCGSWSASDAAVPPPDSLRGQSGRNVAATPHPRRSSSRWPRPRFREVTRFGIVGVANYVLDVRVFNMLLFTALSGQPLAAKAMATTAAAMSSYFMNRYWTWQDRARSGLARELPLFLILSGVGLLITEACLLVSHYGLGLTSRVADNVAANAVGLVLATAWRFLSFKRWVFLAPSVGGPDPSKQ
jgi:putative flippase GtrA